MAQDPAQLPTAVDKLVVVINQHQRKGVATRLKEGIEYYGMRNEQH